ncbi:MAG: protein kinase [Pseudonocardia sp.]|nr:protein kinase [Pseudonocardia sp.]
MSVLTSGHRIGDRYQLDRRIAVGGMGEVWEAEDIRLGRSVAVKVLRPELSGDPEFLHRFRVEARTVASLDHSGIAAVHDYGEDDGPLGGGHTAYLVMELVRGEPLSSLIARGPLEPEQTLRIMEQAARALQAAHERGFVHRDVKPGNILIRVDGKVKLTDFGIAKAADAVPVTRSGMVMGTAHYIAPEQASGAEAGPSGDVYSLGIVGYECLAGHRPFRAESAVAVAMMQVREPPPPLPDVVPEHVRALIDAILVKDPAHRYGTGGELAVAVAAVRRGDPMPIPGIPVQGGSRPMAIDETGETVYPPRPAPESPSGSVPVPAPSMSPISSPGMTPARPDEPPGVRPDEPPADEESGAAEQVSSGSLAVAPTSRRSRRSGSHRSDSSTPRPVAAHHAPTESLRIPPARGPGRGLLLVLFVLLTLAAVALGVFLLRGGLSELTGAAAASTVAVVRFAGSLASATPDTVRNRHR